MTNHRQQTVLVYQLLCYLLRFVLTPKDNERLSAIKSEPTNPLYSLDKQQSSLVYYDKKYDCFRQCHIG